MKTNVGRVRKLTFLGIGVAAALLPTWPRGAASQPSQDLASGTMPILEDVQPRRARSS